MGLILRSSATANAGNTITISSTALTYTQADGNFMYLLTNMSGSNIAITGSAIGIVGNTTIEGSLTVKNALNATSSWAARALTSSFSTNITGSTNKIARYNGSNNLTSSIISDNGISASIYSSTANDYLLKVTNDSTGSIYASANGNGAAIYGYGNNSSTVGIQATSNNGGTALIASSFDGTNSYIAKFQAYDGSILIDSITIDPDGILTLIPISPLPTLKPTGSLAVSGSGTNCKLYLYNGTSWRALAFA